MDASEERNERDGGATAGPSSVDTPSSAVFAKRRNRGTLRKRPAEEETVDGEMLRALARLYHLLMCSHQMTSSYQVSTTQCMLYSMCTGLLWA